MYSSAIHFSAAALSVNSSPVTNSYVSLAFAIPSSLPPPSMTRSRDSTASFSSAPILAYAHAKQTELDAVRLVIEAKRSQIDDDVIRERVPMLYE